MEEWIQRSTAQPRFNLLMLSIFAAASPALAALGIYGLMASIVASHTRESVWHSALSPAV